MSSHLAFICAGLTNLGNRVSQQDLSDDSSLALTSQRSLVRVQYRPLAWTHLILAERLDGFSF